jgi:flavin reductase (DIM6/NTAB) family NADH-FMN oxidoreductase RutF
LLEQQLKQLKKNFSLFATGIAIAATINKKGQHSAITINSLTSLSLTPPLLLFCIDNKSANLEAFKKNQYFSLSILSQSQQGLAQEFSKTQNQSKWGHEPHFFGQFGSPIFSNSLGYFECQRHQIIKAGDHHIIIGEIFDFAQLSNQKPLIYNQGSYAQLAEL